MRKLIFGLLLLFLVSCSSQENAKINGVSFVASPEEIYESNIVPVKELGANWAAVMPFGFIKNLQTPNVVFNLEQQWWGERLEGVEKTIKLLQSEGISVMLKPQIWVWRGEFTGDIKMNAEEDWKLLEKSYTNFILLYAKVAQKYQVPLFCIGTELHTFVQAKPDFWKELIKKVKKVYRGKLTYAENWDQYEKVPFWDQLDFIGIDAYFPLSEKKTPTLIDLNQKWIPHKENMKNLSSKFKKPILFTEYGYRSVNYGTLEPWKTDRSKGNINHILQKNALSSLYSTFWNEPWFAGGFLWKWFHNHEKAGGLEDNRFTVQNKPAQKIVQSQYLYETPK